MKNLNPFMAIYILDRYLVVNFSRFWKSGVRMIISMNRFFHFPGSNNEECRYIYILDRCLVYLNFSRFSEVRMTRPDFFFFQDRIMGRMLRPIGTTGR